MKRETYFPNEKSFKLPIYLEIKMKIIKDSNFKTIGNLLTNASKNLKAKIASASATKDKINAIVDTSNEESNSNNVNETKDLNNNMEEIFTFYTYVPKDFGVSLAASWEAGNFVGLTDTGNLIKKLISKGFGDVGSFFSDKSTEIKNQAEYNFQAGLTEKQIKLFKPLFINKAITFTFQPNNSEDSLNLLKTAEILKQGVIPKSTNGQFYNFPATFDINVVLVDDSGKVSTEINKITTLLNEFNNLGMTDFSFKQLESDQLDMKINSDGTPKSYNLSMTFTSIERLKSDQSTLERIKTIYGK